MGFLDRFFGSRKKPSAAEDECPQCGLREGEHKSWCPEVRHHPDPREDWARSMAEPEESSRGSGS